MQKGADATTGIGEMTRAADSKMGIFASADGSTSTPELKLSRSACADVCAPVSFLCCCLGLFTVQPNHHVVLLHCGVPTAVIKEPGCHYSNFCGREMLSISTAQTSLDLNGQKILDRNGNPLVVSAVVSYRFDDALAALLQVNDARAFVATQAAAAIKLVVGRFSYDELKLEATHISDEMCKVLQPRISIAGATVSNVTLNELNYAPEIAAAMLKKQQASALVEARHLVVQGAVSICQEAVASLEAGGLTLSQDDKVKIICNLLTVTTGDKEATPVLPL